MKNNIIIRLALSAIVAISVMLTGCGRTELDMNKYVTIDLVGYNTVGNASAKLDVDKMVHENLDAFDCKSSSESDVFKAIVDMQNLVGDGGLIDKTEELSNGDTINWAYSSSIDPKEIEKRFPVKLYYSNFSVKVDGLEEPKEVDPFEGYNLTFEGLDGKGSVNRDYDFEHKHDWYFKIDDLYNDKLKNGDKIIVKIEYPEETQKEQLKKGIKLTALEKEYTVTGLTEYQEINPFDYISVKFSGTAPRGECDIDIVDDRPFYFDYSIDQQYNLSNGDKVIITINNSDDADYYGCTISETEKEYTVEGLPYYVQNISDISGDLINKMKAHCKDIMETEVNNSWDNPKQFKGMSFRGCYLLKKKKDAERGWEENKLVFVYKISTTSNVQSDYYWCTSFNDIIMLNDGTYTYDMSDASLSSDCTYFELHGIGDEYSDYEYVYGYKNFNLLYDNIITANIKDYDYDSTVEE